MSLSDSLRERPFLELARLYGRLLELRADLERVEAEYEQACLTVDGLTAPLRSPVLPGVPLPPLPPIASLRVVGGPLRGEHPGPHDRPGRGLPDEPQA